MPDTKPFTASDSLMARVNEEVYKKGLRRKPESEVDWS